MNVPHTPHPRSFSPKVDATIFLYLSLNLSNLHAIKELIALKNPGSIVDSSRLATRMEYLGKILDDPGSNWCKKTVREELEKSITRDAVNHIADMDENCVEMLRKVRLSGCCESLAEC